MDDKLIMAIDIVEVLRTFAESEDLKYATVLQYAADHIEDLRGIADRLLVENKALKTPAPPPAPPVAPAKPAPWNPDNFMDAGE